MFKKFVLTLVITALPTLIFAQKQLTLSEAVGMALQKNTTLKAAENNLGNNEAALQSAYGGILPSVNANAGWSWSRTDIGEKDITTPGGASATLPSTTIESRNWNAGVSATTTLYDGLSVFKNYDRAKNQLKTAQFEIERLKQDVAFSTINKYYDLIKLQELILVREDNLKWNQQNLEVITERNRLGAVTLADLYTAQVKVGNAELLVLQAQNEFAAKKNDFLFYLGLESDVDYTIADPTMESLEKDPSVIKQALNLNLDEYVTTALENRADYQSAKLRLDAAMMGVDIAGSGYLPRLTNTISYGGAGSNPGDILDNRTLSVGLNLSIPLFSGWSTTEQVQRAEIATMNSKIDMNDKRREIINSLEKTFLNLQAAAKQLEVTKKNIVAASETRRIEEEKYRLGATTLVNLLIANTDFLNARNDFINAAYLFRTLEKEIKYNIGTLNASSLE